MNDEGLTELEYTIRHRQEMERVMATTSTELGIKVGDRVECYAEYDNNADLVDCRGTVSSVLPNYICVGFENLDVEWNFPTNRWRAFLEIVESENVVASIPRYETNKLYRFKVNGYTLECLVKRVIKPAASNR